MIDSGQKAGRERDAATAAVPPAGDALRQPPALAVSARPGSALGRRVASPAGFCPGRCSRSTPRQPKPLKTARVLPGPKPSAGVSHGDIERERDVFAL